MMNAVLAGLLRIVRAGMATINPVQINMNILMNKIVTGAEYALQKSGAKLEVSPLPSCWADETQIMQVFTNLVDNAIKYLQPGKRGLIKIYGRIEGDRSIYCVEDNGKGIAAEYQLKIFEQFFRASPEKRAKGEGLGLTISKRMVDRNGGRIWVESKIGEGSKFCVALPY